jgi:hypothetical protein
MRSIPLIFGLVLCVSASCKKAGSEAPVGTSNLTNIKYVSDKLPSKGSKAITQHATKGGTGSTFPIATSRTADEEDTDRQSRKPENLDKADCENLPDNVGECDGDKFYFCDDKKLWVTDCAAEAKFGGAQDGSCYEGDKFVDCLGCGKADDGSHVCYDFSQTVCCMDDGSCYSPK